MQEPLSSPTVTIVANRDQQWEMPLTSDDLVFDLPGELLTAADGTPYSLYSLALTFDGLSPVGFNESSIRIDRVELVPEPTSAMIIAIGSIGIMISRSRRKVI